MKKIAVLGANFGDEGKGSITHKLSKDFDWVCRFNGGPNAGHTIYRDGQKYVHHLLPSIDFRYEHVKGFIGSGTVIDLSRFYNELVEAEKFFSGVSKRIVIDPCATVVLPEHVEEDKATNSHLGSTNRGIGPAYVSKYRRSSIRVLDLLKRDDELTSSLKWLGVKFQSSYELLDEFKQSSVLFEGAQGVLLDVNHGTYPYVSCSDATVSGIGSCGFNSIKLDRVYGVTKCYSTRVGAGPFPTELHGKEAETLRALGKEYGATTGRPRRVGWLDLEALKYATVVGGITDLVVTKFDILNGLKEVPICVTYETRLKSNYDFQSAKPVYAKINGWNDASDISQLSNMIDLIEQVTNLQVSIVSHGTAETDVRVLNP